MKSVLISIKPKWCELIASGKKTVEVRKTKPKLKTPFKVYIYCTTPKNKHDNLVLTPFGYDVGSEAAYCHYAGNSNGKVIGEFACDKVVQFENSFFEPAFDEASDLSCVRWDELVKYLGNKDYGYGWHISDLVIYDKPRELSEFYAEGDCDFKNCSNCDRLRFISKTRADCNLEEGYKPITRPPQSWCYVEDTE